MVTQRIKEAVGDDIMRYAIGWAGDLGRKVAPRGQSHSVYGRAQVRDGIVIDMTQLAAVHEVQNDHVVVGAGATWSAVLAATLPRGWSGHRRCDLSVRYAKRQRS